jgi:hypothetical protein
MKGMDKRAYLVLSIFIVNLFVVLACPSLYTPPPFSAQRSKVLIYLIISATPLIWTLFLILWGRSRFALVLALINLIPAVGWLIAALPLVTKAFY